MIEQKAIYEAQQEAFASAHPKFPFPKKHTLEEQNDEFRRAYLMFCASINKMNENEVSKAVERNTLQIEKYYKSKFEFETEQLQANKNWGWIAAVVAFAILIFFFSV